jgi:hypothetical protein
MNTSHPPKPLARHLLRSAVALAALFALPAAQADERSELEQLRATTMALIQALVDQGLISAERAQALLKQAAPRPGATVVAAAAPAAAPAPEWGASAPHTVRVPYIPETVKAQMKQDIADDVLATARAEGWADARQIPAWLKTFTFEGDLRVRAESDLFDKGNAPAFLYQSQTASPAWSPDLTNTQNSYDRLTLRARFGFKAAVGDDITAGMRLSTGATPTSASQTLGSGPGFSNRYAIGLDRAWIDWEPRQDYHFTAGRMETPFYGTDLLWPEDLSLDGVALRGLQNVGSGAYGFATLGAFALQQFNIGGPGKWLFGGQVGGDWAVTDATSIRLSAAVYDFHRVEGVRETDPAPTGALAATEPYEQSQYPAGARLRGNTLININDPTNPGAPVWGLASKFRPVDVTAALTLRQFEPVQVGLSFDYVRNSGFDLADIERRAGTASIDSLANMTTGVQAKLQVGSRDQSQRGAWNTFLAYRQFDRDAWVDAFTDTTWNLGGTNYRGFSVGGSYTFDRRSTLGLRWTTTRNLDDGVRTLSNPSQPTSVIADLSSAPLKIDVIQLDLNTKF